MTAFFARRCTDTQAVADLTAETFARAIGSYASFDPGKGSGPAWLFGIARRVYAQHCAHTADERLAIARFAGHRALEAEELEELAARIDSQRAGRELIEGATHLPPLERAAFELVDLAGLTPKEAASALNVSVGALRVRLFRARARLRKEHSIHEQL